MSAATRQRSLPIRRWLALALVACFLIPALVTGFTVFHLAGVGDPEDEISVAADQLREDVGEWDDPQWQAATRADLEERGVDFTLYEGDREIYQSRSNLFVDADGGDRALQVQQIVIPGSDPQLSALIYAEETLGPPEGIWLAPVIALVTLLITLAGIAWFLGRTVVEPLRAASSAANQVAGGDLTVSLPASRVQEVGEVNRAMEAMSEGLRASVEQQAELEQERRAFVGAIAHDLRTPLFSLRGALEGLQAGLASTPEKRERYVSIAQQKADALERLISDLFDYTRLEYLDQTPSREPLELNSLLMTLVEGLQPQAEQKNVTLELITPVGDSVVYADEHLLTRAIENLLDNALRFTPSGGRVRIESHQSQGRMVFSISDTGPGLAPEDLPHVFSPLYRAEASRNRNTGGVGLGLTIARRILRAHDGDLTAGNSDRGAVFNAWLPQSTGDTPLADE